jgi:hypothetical protein
METAPLSGDPEIRQALRAYLARRDVTGTPAVIEELGLCQGQVRADVVVVGELLHAYEIKSDRDSLTRLAHQAEIYGQTMDRVTLVAGNRHMAEALRVVPRWWGAIRADETANGLRLTELRKGRKNTNRDQRALVELLWHSDALRFLEERGMARGLKGKPRRYVWDRICAEVSLDEIAAAVRRHLVGRIQPECSQQCA